MYKLVLDNFHKEFGLIGICSTLEGYKLAYLINKQLNVNFSKTRSDVILNFNQMDLSFELYRYEDFKTESTLYLVQNKSKYNTNWEKTSNSLFEVEQTIYKYLIQSHKQAEFLLKIEDESMHYKSKALISALNEIPQLISAFEIPFNEIKSAENLIFE